MEIINQEKIDITTFLQIISKKSIQIIDIREKYEYELGNIPDSFHIPMDEILRSIDKIEKSKKVILYCRSGKRSSAVKYMLNREYKLQNIYCLEGGYTAYLEHRKTNKFA